jgi:hypothetical protein
MYIEENNTFYSINNWPFLSKTQLTSSITINNNNSIIDLTEPVYLLTYQVKNVGHTFVNLLEQIHCYIRMNLSCKIVLCKDLLNINTFMKSFLNLFFHMSQIIILESNQLYNFEKLHLFVPGNYTLQWKYTNNIDNNHKLDNVNNKMDNVKIYDYCNRIKYNNDTDVINKFWTFKLNMIIDNLKIKNNYGFTNKKICIIKNTNDLHYSPHISNNNFLVSCFDQSYITLFEKMGFEIINCSTTNIKDLINILNNSSILISSWGCNAYLNKYLINNKNINILLLAHIYYEEEYKLRTPHDFLPLCNKCKVIYNLKSSLDEQSTKYIVDSITEME